MTSILQKDSWHELKGPDDSTLLWWDRGSEAAYIVFIFVVPAMCCNVPRPPAAVAAEAARDHTTATIPFCHAYAKWREIHRGPFSSFKKRMRKDRCGGELVEWVGAETESEKPHLVTPMHHNIKPSQGCSGGGTPFFIAPE